MTNAPSNLLAVRTLMLDKLGPYGLGSLEMGVVGDSDHRGGYHCGSDRVVAGDYSVLESDRDRNGLTLDASALDVGTFTYGSHNLRTFSRWMVAQCVAGAPDTKDIREIIYSPDGQTVKRWDRLGIRTTGDSSHLGHTHFSFFRDSTKARRDQTPLFRRYLTAIGLIEGASELFCNYGDSGEVVRALQVRLKNLGFDLGAAGADGRYGDATKKALRAACVKVYPDTGADGSAYNADTIFYVDVLISRTFGPQVSLDEVNRRLAALESQPAGGGLALPATVQITGNVTLAQ